VKTLSAKTDGMAGKRICSIFAPSERSEMASKMADSLGGLGPGGMHPSGPS